MSDDDDNEQNETNRIAHRTLSDREGIKLRLKEKIRDREREIEIESESEGERNGRITNFASRVIFAV